MSAARALVVDDSRSARESLARLLSRYDLEVHFAESGEAALDFLKQQLVDVVFMDHTMPGMDGLEAVSAIKGNPRTATIPVMMYTAKEGEVYVGQARALGALGVLPKQVQPGVLYDMLRKLGLARERRADGSTDAETPPRQRYAATADDVDREYDDRAMAASVQTLITRVLEDHHTRLLGDLLAGQRRVAREVVREALAANAPQPPAPTEPIETPARPDRNPWMLSTLLAVVLSIVLGISAWQLRAQRDATLMEVAEVSRSAAAQSTALLAERANIDRASSDRHSRVAASHAITLGTLEWALNQGLRVPFDQPPFNDDLAGRMEILVDRLAAADFRGRVLLTAQLGAFCMSRDAFGSLTLAPEDLPAADCEVIGHPLEGRVAVESLQTVAFAAALDYLSARHDGIAVSLRGAEGVPGVRIPSGTERAGDWNRQASTDNRVMVALIGEGGGGS